MSHLNREADDQIDDGEEEFYYTEVEMAPPPPPRVRSYSHSVVFDLSLADHLYMVRPPHEDPGIVSHPAGAVSISRPAAKVRSFSGGNRFNNSSLLTTAQPTLQQQNPLTMPITIAPSAGSPGKFILISPPSQSSASIKSPTRRIREGKKCRKVYGLEQRDLWCTQCKWKKACARFGSHALEKNNNQHHPAGAISLPSQSNSLLMTAHQIRGPFDTASSAAIKAIKF